jgi:DNA-binding transcriptional ArsR family regulator
MSLRLLLMRDSEVLCEVPLTPSHCSKDELEAELDDFRRRLFKTYSIMLNENRVRMLRSLMEEEDSTLNFKELMEDLKMNPKIIREHAMRLSDAGFLETPARGRYHLSNAGRVLFMVAGPALLRIFDTIIEELSE